MKTRRPVVALSHWLTMPALLAALVSAAPVAQAAGTPDALDRPSVVSPRVARLLMTSVARAGARIVAVGERGVILYSDDQGHSWQQASSVPVSVTLTRVQFVSDTLGWATGHSGVVLHTQDGGKTWVKQLDGRQAAKIELAQAQAEGANPQRVGNAEHLVADGPDKPFFGLYFADAKHGWVVGAYGLALHTSDGGASWQSLMGRFDNAKGRHLYSILPLQDKLYLLGEQGAVFRSVNGGAAFEELTTPSRGTYFGAVACGTNCLLAYGLRGNANRSVDGGQSWQAVKLPPASLTAGLALGERSVLLANEAGQLLLSRDAGDTFKEVSQLPAGSMVSLLQYSNELLLAAGIRNMTSIDLRPMALQEASK